MSDLQAPESVANDIRAAAKEVGALVVPALPGGRGLPKSVLVDLVDLLALIRHLRPRLVYLEEIRFEAAPNIADLVDEDDEALVEHPLVRAAARRLKQHEGSLCQVVAIVVHDGIDHAVIHEAAWMGEVKGVAERISADLEQRAQVEAERQHLAFEAEEKERREREEREKQALVREKAETLEADPRFAAGKSKAKRLHLAKTLFPALPNATLTKIVDEAEGTIWLRRADG